MGEDSKRIYQVLSYTFKDERIIQEALTPPFPQKQPSGNNMIEFKRLKWLGDSILDMVATDMVYKYFPDEDEGYLAKKKKHLVEADTLSEVAKLIRVDEFMYRDAYGFLSDSERTVRDTVEAIIGAIYLDSNIENVTEFIKRYWTTFMKNCTNDLKETVDIKNILKQFSEQNKIASPTYHVIEITGSGHNPTYKVKVTVKNLCEAFGFGRSKKDAEKEAAKLLCNYIMPLDKIPVP